MVCVNGIELHVTVQCLPAATEDTPGDSSGTISFFPGVGHRLPGRGEACIAYRRDLIKNRGFAACQWCVTEYYFKIVSLHWISHCVPDSEV